jgi:phosphatidylserine/phosphatidylglycerophosphate/cardiolipin synthase-like enzyme
VTYEEAFSRIHPSRTQNGQSHGSQTEEHSVNCFQVSIPILEQLGTWVASIESTLVQLCTTVTQQLMQWQQQWQNQCTQTTSQVCQSLPWPLSALCSVVTTTVCGLVSVLILVAVLIVQVVCTLVTVLVAILLFVIVFFIAILLWILCIIVPCAPRMESSTPPDGGWLVSLGGDGSPGLSQNNMLVKLPDGMLACQSVIAAIGNAKERIHLLELEFNPSFEATFAVGGAPTLLTSALLAANETAVKVRILVNDNSFGSSVKALRTFFSTAPGANTVEVLGLHVFPEVLHAKALIIDGLVAFIVGLPLDQGYWDTQFHPVSDPLHRGSGAGGNQPGFGDVGNGVGNKPVHTVTLQLTGPSAADVDNTFINLWNSVSSADQIPAALPQPSDGGTQSVQIVRTAPRLSATGLSNGEKGILEAYLRAINNARRFIYLEEQYFTSPVIVDALVHALQSNSDLQLILLLNENPDIPTYKLWQNMLLNQLASFPSGQVRAFTLWRTTPPGDQQVEIMQCYVEAKVAVVDDVWATVGSGNLDGASLCHIFEFLPSPLSCFSGDWRNIELNAVLYDGIAGQPATGQVAALRTVLWREHLGDAADLEGDPPPGGWLRLWSKIANDNLMQLNATQTMTGGPEQPSRILAYAPALDTEAQLSQLGVNTSMFNVAPAVPT